MNLNMKKRMSGTPAPKLNTIVTAYLTSYSLKKYPYHTFPSLNFDKTQLAKFPTTPSSKTKVVKIQKGPQKSGLGLICSRKSPLYGGIMAALILSFTFYSLTLKYSSQYFCLQNRESPCSFYSVQVSCGTGLGTTGFSVTKVFCLLNWESGAYWTGGLALLVWGEQLQISYTRSNMGILISNQLYLSHQFQSKLQPPNSGFQNNANQPYTGINYTTFD